MLILIWHVTAGERRTTSWLGRMEKFCCCNKVQEFPSSHWMRMYLFWLFFFSEFWSTRSDDTLPGGCCWLKRCMPEAEQAYIHHGYCALSFLLCFCILFQRVIFLVSSHLTTPVTVLVLIQLCCCLIVMFIVTNFGDAKRTIKVLLSSGFIVIFSFART